ncbi:hypothetical protein LXE97_07620 [Escherichia marmotae]|uniref:hypothetical protein n=1 Tax=Escherichia TaxID=561 RepID=UPI0002481EC4|nr:MULTISPECIES: hypothetical protein [Escherichia]MBB2335485.1 hypothetical protein [Escherichia sp. 93.0724]MCL0882780.1 hypothetical protein [Escherichia marmotae]MDZ3931519.1 hypothetical protein [Escherichia marmotae]MEC9586321.1 hypothetical protein [Escherichia marmotae]MEC9638623.1 hypothetical protein [Escherichia marmotae]
MGGICRTAVALSALASGASGSPAVRLRHTIDSRCTFVGFNSFQGLPEIDWFTNGFHQPHC